MMGNARKPAFRRPLLLAAAAFAVLGIANSGRIQAQSSVSRPEFEVASIRRNVEGGPIVFNGMKSPGTFSAQNQTVRNLIQEAYGSASGGRRNWLPFFVAPGQGVQILGGPAWISSDRYDITAKWNAVPADGPITIESIEKTQSEMDLMLRSLLEQRFGVRVHRETRDLPIYEMTLDNPRKLSQGRCITFDPGDPKQSRVVDGQTLPYCGASGLGRKGLDWTLDGAGMKMAQLADTLSFLIGNRTVVDKTGYAGTFDAHLRWTPGQGELIATDAPASRDDVGESIFTVVQDLLGLKLKAGKGPVEVLVIDSAERPAAN
jgi:uncharacterized protein (TIGR03435 family)